MKTVSLHVTWSGVMPLLIEMIAGELLVEESDRHAFTEYLRKAGVIGADETPAQFAKAELKRLAAFADACAAGATPPQKGGE